MRALFEGAFVKIISIARFRAEPPSRIERWDAARLWNEYLDMVRVLEPH